jgi:putative transcriptional regulator
MVATVTAGRRQDRDVPGSDPRVLPELSGQLLVASPQLADPNFSRTVVLVLEHGEPGAVGVVLNRPLEVGVGEVLASWEDLAAAAPPGVVFSGGPVSPDAVIGMARAAPGASASDWRAVFAGVGVVDLSVSPADQPVALQAARLFSGYAGWDAEQLEGEIDEGAWFVVDALVADVFGSEAELLWHDVLQRQGGRLAMLAAYPPTPTVN